MNETLMNFEMVGNGTVYSKVDGAISLKTTGHKRGLNKLL